MWSPFKQKKKKEAKKIILKTFFNYSEQKKAVIKAAKESAKDQREMVEKYRELKLSRNCR